MLTIHRRIHFDTRSLVLILALIVVLGIVATLPALRDIPMTNHAVEGHVGQQWTAEIISARLSSRSCRPILAYSCKSTIIVLCPVGDPADLWTGLVIGTANGAPVIVTGYAAPREYWFKRVFGCVPTSYVP